MTNKLLPLLKKNIIYELRSGKAYILEVLIIIISILFFIISLNPFETILSSKKLNPSELKRTKLKENYAEIKDLDMHQKIMQIPQKHYGLLYTPIHKTTQDIMLRVSEALALDESKGFDAAVSVDSILKKFNKNEFLAVVIFHKFTEDLLSITIRFPSQFRTLRKGAGCWDRPCFWTTRYSGSLDAVDLDDSSQNVDLYIREGFLQIQHEIFKAWINVYDVGSEHQEIPSVTINSFLRDTDKEINFHSESINFVWIFYNFLYFVPFLNLVWKIAREREENIVAHHWIYGFSHNHHWFAHLIIALLHLFVLNSLIMVFLMIKWPGGSISNTSQTVYLMVFLILYSCMLILNAFCLSTIIGDAKTTVILAASLWLASYGIFSYHLANATSIDLQVLFMLVIFINNCFPFGMMYLEEDHSDKEMPNKMWFLLLIQICLIAFYSGCLQCLDRPRYMKRRNYGRCSLKCKEKEKEMAKSQSTTLDESNSQNFEYGPVEGHVLSLKNVFVYQNRGKRNPVLNNISMRLFRNEISVILGSHSSGKTTLISVLAGWQRYHGLIYYEEYKEVSENWLYYRRHIDVSMPNNPLYDLLTVEEQLQYILLTKQQLNSNETQMKIELNKWLMTLKSSIRDSTKMIKTLNFNQKRLVSLCCTLSANTKIILLDEPTQRMGFEERRLYWRILRQEKLNRVIVMTTFSIDEASEIGDRIGILNNGSLVAWGTPFHLKSHLNQDTYLVIFLAPMSSIKPITLRLEKYLPSVAVHRQFNDRIIYKLPNENRAVFQRMLIDLEKQSNAMGVTSMYVAGMELNDVYMQMTADVKKQQLPNMEETLKFLNYPVPQDRQIHMSSALFYKKLLYQAANVTPIVVLFLSIALIMMIYEMSEHFVSHDHIQIGYRPHKEVVISGSEHCKYLEISTIDDMRRLKSNLRSRNWFADKLKCGYAPYKDDILKDDNIYNKLGAVERDGQDKSQLKIWINEKIFDSAALTLNLAHNVILNDLYPNTKHKMVNINNEPIWEPIRQKIALNHFNNLNFPLTMGIIMPLTVASFIVMPIDERRSHMVILQQISGVSQISFWLTNFIWDYAVYGIITLIYFLLMCSYTIDEFLLTSKLAVLLLLSLYGIGSLLLVYTVFLYNASDNKLRGVLKIFLLQFVIGFGAFIVYWEVADKDPFYWYYIMMISSPTFALLVGIVNVQHENMVRFYCLEHCGRLPDGCNGNKACSLIPQCCTKSFLQWSFPGILPSLFFMLLTGLILLIIFIGTIVYRSRKKYSTPERIKQMSSVCYPYEDEKVIAEKVRISDMNVRTCKAHTVLVDQLEYNIPKLGNRVETISFALNGNSCLGIYGPGHSGKTHLIKQLIGEDSFRFGEVYICGHEIKRNLEKAIQNLGYCPQTNGFCEGSTPQQLFALFYRLSGITEAKSSTKIRELSLIFNLRNYMNTRISELPYHIRRRLNIALALLVQSQVLIFDEPTSGLTAHERYLLWNAMRYAKASGKAIIFTSQDTVELEQLADFIIVVDNGAMLSIDSPQSIRQLYTVGFYLEIKLKSDGETLEEMEDNLRKDIENLQRFVVFLHADSEWLNRHGNVLKFYIPIENVTYSYLFGTMEKNRHRLNIAEYLISQGTLQTALDNLRNAHKNKIRYKISKN